MSRMGGWIDGSNNTYPLTTRSLTLGLMVNGVAITGHATSYRGLIFSVQHVFELLGKLKVGSELDVVVGDRECK